MLTNAKCSTVQKQGTGGKKIINSIQNTTIEYFILTVNIKYDS